MQWGYENTNLKCRMLKYRKQFSYHVTKCWLIYKYIKFKKKLPTYCTETLNHLKTLSQLKHWTTWKHWITWNTELLEIEILWLQIDLTNLNQLECEVSATILGEFWLQSWISLNKSFYFNLLIDEALLLWVCHLTFTVSDIWKTSYLCKSLNLWMWPI